MATHTSCITHHLPRTKLVARLLTWFSTNARALPWRRTRDPYAIWVSEIMLQQTQVKTVIPYWERWMHELPTIQTAAKASPAKLHKLWEGLGYYTRVRNLQKAARQIIALHDGKFPENFDDIHALSGIGRYTAGAIASIAFNQPRPILDGNVIRMLTRIFGIATDPREKQTNARLWQLAEELVLHASHITHHASPCSHLNQSLMELGALICTPRSPQCGVCTVNNLCLARKQGLQEQLPNLAKSIKPTNRRFLAFIVERNGKFLVRQRTAGVVNAHLWEFPNVEVGARLRDPQNAAENELGVHLSGIKPLHAIKHSITRYRITLEAWRAELTSPNGAPVSDPARSKNAGRNSPGRRPALPGKWLALAQLHQLAFTSAHKKIVARLAQ
jgi:A/G-specific adenine glycosylase